jgi:hypothetical protein
LTLNRNPRNYFAETEQIMFQPGHLVRGIDLTEDPLLQGRMLVMSPYELHARHILTLYKVFLSRYSTKPQHGRSQFRANSN